MGSFGSGLEMPLGLGRVQQWRDHICVGHDGWAQLEILVYNKIKKKKKTERETAEPRCPLEELSSKPKKKNKKTHCCLTES